MARFTNDYGIILRDKSGRIVTLSIIGACIDDLIKDGYSKSEAVESVEGNAFQNAVARGEIGDDAVIISAKQARIYLAA